jgi:hypothetical protein
MRELNNITLYKEPNMTRKTFEKKIANAFTGKLARQPHSENAIVNGQPVIKKMTLYYENDIHIATWEKGDGWFI